MSPPARAFAVPDVRIGSAALPSSVGPVRDQAVWTRVDGVQGMPLDLLSARFGSHHFAPHTHDEFAIGVCVDGLETMRYRGERLYFPAGTMAVIEPGEAHTGGPAGPEGFAYLVLYPNTAMLSAAAPDGGGSATGAASWPHFRDPLIDDPRMGAELRLAHLALRRGDDPLEGETRLSWLLSVLVHRYGDAGRRTQVRPVRRGPEPGRIAHEVAARLADQLTGPPTLAEVAADLDLSRFQLLRAFRGVMGMPPYAWLAQHRVTRARALLDAGHRPAEAATLVGFADQAHLTRWFRRVVGVTPGAYRNSVQDAARHPAPR